MVERQKGHTMSKYRVFVEPKSQQGDTADQIKFVLEADDYKQAWVDARNICRTGGEPTTEDNEQVTIQPGMYTVRKVFALDRRGRKSKVVTLDDFVAAAEAENVPLNKRTMALIDQLRGAPAPDQTEPETQENEAA